MSRKIEYSIDYNKLRGDINFKINTVRDSASYDIPEYLFAAEMGISGSTLSTFLSGTNRKSLHLESIFKICTWMDRNPNTYIIRTLKRKR